MITFIYVVLYSLMFFILYQAGKGLKKNGGKIFSRPGLAAILAYSINEGLRFGRGINYNNYWQLYEEVSKGIEQDRDVCFVFLVKIMIYLGIPYQGLIMFESLMLIFGMLFLLRNFCELLPLSLTLFVLFSFLPMENMVRWYIGFSFLLIGLSFLVKCKTKKYFLFCIIGCLLHIGLLPVTILFFFFFFFKKPLLHPLISIAAFVAIGFFFNTDFMLQFSDMFNMVTSLSERAESYQKSAEMWLTGGYGGVYRSAFPTKREMLFFFLIVWAGYKSLRVYNHGDVFVYNLFLFGFLIKPIANQIELLNRYHTVFFFFRAIVLSLIILNLYSTRIFNQIVVKVVILLVFWEAFTYVRYSYLHPQLHMYIWDRTNENWDTQKQRWIDIQEKEAYSLEKQNRK